jgi:hypothetical protein
MNGTARSGYVMFQLVAYVIVSMTVKNLHANPAKRWGKEDSWAS